MIIPGYYVRHRAALYDSNHGGWWRYSDWMYTLQEAEKEYQNHIRKYATTIQLIHILENPLTNELKEVVVKESKADIGAKTRKAQEVNMNAFLIALLVVGIIDLIVCGVCCAIDEDREEEE